MKRILLASAVLFGAVAASQAGVHFSLGIAVPLVAPPAVVVSPPPIVVAPAPVYTAPPVVYAPPPVVCAPPPVVCAPAPGLYFGFGWGGRYHGWGARGWHR